MIDLIFDTNQLMYTKVLLIISIITAIWFVLARNRVNYFLLTIWLFACCPFAWLEFASLNVADIIPAWIFSKEQILGIYILYMSIEDFFFAITFGVLFYLVFTHIPKGKGTSSEFNKLLVFISLILITMFFFNFGSYMARYQCLRMGFGLFGIYYSWKTWNLKHFGIIIGIIFAISASWDLYANLAEIQHWFYRFINTPEGLKPYSKVYANWDWWWFKIGKAWFTLEILPFYYLSGGVFTYGLLNAFNVKFPKISRNLFTAFRQIRERGLTYESN